jgi:hypothetical protein
VKQTGDAATTVTQRTHEQLVQDLVTAIQRAVDPSSWSDGRGSLREAQGHLVITQTRANHDALLALLQSRRSARGVQVVVEVRFITSPALEKELARDPVARGDGGGGASDELWPQLLDDAAVQRILRTAQREKQSTLITAPRLTLFDGQRAYATVSRQVAYVADVRLNAAGTDVEPLIDLVSTGIVIDLRAAVSDDRRFATLTLRPQLASLVDLVPSTRPEKLVGKPVTVQIPYVEKTSADTTVTIPDGKTALYRLRSRVEPPMKNAPRPKTQLMLVTPRIVVQTEPAANS